MLCLHNAWNFQEVFLIILSLFANLKLMSVLFIHEMFLVEKLEIFTNCKEVKHIMVMIIAIIYIFVSFEIFDQQFKITFRKSSVLPTPPSPPKKKNPPSPFLLTPPLKIQNVQVPPFLPPLKIFQAPLAERRDEGHYAFFTKNGLILPNFRLIQ